MNKIVLLNSLLMFVNIVAGQTAANTSWKFVKGDTAIPLLPSYGTKGVPSNSNQPAGRTGFVTCKDKHGNFWLFGGTRSQAALNDLWKYDISSNTWTWVSGDDTTFIHRVFGTKGVAAVTNEPGGRSRAVAWIDSADNFWLFGGKGYTYNYGGYFNDLWKYNISTNVWTWMSGDSITREVGGNYGSYGVEATTNRPGARKSPMGWSDGLGNLWLFGRTGFANNFNAAGGLNDLWKYNTSTNAWTWVKGDSIINRKSVFGTKGVSAEGNNPGGRSSSATWTDNSGKYWLFGGSGYSNDLWKYDPLTNQ
jgi:hypothetical protein